ncbi:MAG: hypothetical protein WC082_07880 [Victivallales bacterium]
MRKTISAVMIAAVLVGCNSTPEKKSKPTPDLVAGRNVPKQKIPSIRDYEIVKTYHLGRRIDPDNPNIMYEAGKMYVIRRTPTWNLRPNAPVVSAEKRKSFDIALENLQKQRELRKRSLSGFEKVGSKLLETQKEIEDINRKQAKEDLSSGIKEIQESQGRIKRKMAEFDK